MGLTAALSVAGRSLEVFTAGIQVASQNIANANTPGYIREQLNLDSQAPTAKGQLIFGTGVVATSITQQIDLFLEVRVHAASSDFSASQAKESIFKQLESTINELGENDLSTSFSNFTAALNNVVNTPETGASRQLLIQQGQQLAQDINSLRSNVDELRRTQDTKIDALVDESNLLIDQIADLNPKIARVEASGIVKSDAGGLRSQRYKAMTRLAEILPIRFDEKQDGTVDILAGNSYLILAGQKQYVETETVNDKGVGVSKIFLTETKADLSDTGRGELSGVIQGRDDTLGSFVEDLDKLAASVIFEFNKIHASGEGLQGFTSVTSQERIDDTSATLNNAGLPFTPKHGSFEVKVVNKLTGSEQTTTISIDLDGIGTDTTLDSLRAALDGITNVSSSITSKNELKIDAGANYEIRFGNDSSNTLASLGINTFFTGSDSDTIGVNQAIVDDQNLLATSQGGGPADGRNVIELATFLDNKVSGLNDLSIDSFYELTVAGVAQASAAESAIADGLGAFRESLLNQREQYSGVSLDEEAINVIELQRSFQSAARIISVIDELFTVLLNM